MKAKHIILIFAIAIAGGLVALFSYSVFFDKEKRILSARVETPVRYVNLPGEFNETTLDFTYAAEQSVHTVVHVTTEMTATTYRNPIYEFFYGDRYQEPEPVLGFGSGVIVSDDGYIVTNNHVVEKSQKIKITLNDKREFSAELVGADPSTDLALIKVNAKDLPYIRYGNSDDLKVGEWVLAVGNPFNIASTVTAGIVSAKGKNLGIIQDNYRIESFIQTDAAVNRGNSGGALVNKRGELVGINTAIVSPSGGYAGISFAIPVSIVQKVIADLIEYGSVQRAFLGVTISDVTADLIKEQGLDKIEGVYVAEVRDGGAAKDAGIEAGDLILKINDVNVSSPAELTEQVNRYRPGDKITVLTKRKGKTKQFDVTLRNLQGDTKIVKPGTYETVLGAKLVELGSNEKKELGLANGVKITELSAGKLRSAGIKEGFIITKVNNKSVETIETFKKIIDSTRGGVFIEGIYPDGVVAYYAFGL
ncbi:MAG: Do family serine endopeptidase [Bacteroidales bacterium]|nr:Do family serine endopeptidase [Bacteroidales bacterium]